MQQMRSRDPAYQSCDVPGELWAERWKAEKKGSSEREEEGKKDQQEMRENGITNAG